MSEQNTLKKKAIYGVILSFSGTIGTQLIQLIIQIILARLLTPKDFGIIGMVTIFLTLSQVFIDSGFTTGLIREKNSTQEDYSTIFFFNLIISIVLYLILFASADLISDYFKEPQLLMIIKVLSLILIINAFGLIQRTMLTKNINFKNLTIIDLISAILSGVIAIIFALLGFGVWSLVIKTITMQFLQSLLLSIFNRWMPSWTFSFSSFIRLFNFSWKLLLASLLSTLFENIYYVIIGKAFSTKDLGFYVKAKSLVDISQNLITNPIQKVSYPVLSNIQDDEERLRRGYKKMIISSSYITFPLMFGLASIAPQILIILLGEQWIPAIPYFQILCLGGTLYSLNAINLNILQVKGRSDLFLFLSIIRRIISLLFIVIVLYFNLGIIALIWSTAASSYISFIINSFYSKKLLSYSTLDQIKDVSIYFIMSILMSTFIFLFSMFINVNIFLSVFLKIAFGVIFYIFLSLIFKVKIFFEIKDIGKILFMKIIQKNI